MSVRSPEQSSHTFSIVELDQGFLVGNPQPLNSSSYRPGANATRLTWLDSVMNERLIAGLAPLTTSPHFPNRQSS